MKPVAEFKRRKRRPKVKFKIEELSYKNVELLKNFMNDKGKISPARVTGLDAKLQRKVAKEIKRARQIALLPYTKMKPVAEFKRRKRRPKVKFKIEELSYKNVELLKNFMNDKGKISPARVTGLDAKLQRKVAKEIKRARQIALLPYTKIEK